jgi:FlaA1/EpsC-like NDP-sugar epimerase
MARLGHSSRTMSRIVRFIRMRLGGDGSWFLLLRRLLLMASYAGILAGSLCLAWLLQFDFTVPGSEWENFRHNWWWMVLLQLGVFGFFRQFSGIMYYFSVPDLKRMAAAVLVSSSVFLVARGEFKGVYGQLPRGVIVLDALITLVAIGAARLGWRLFYERAWHDPKKIPPQQRAGIVGAGDAGARLVGELSARPRAGLRPVLFLDDAPRKWGSDVHGLPVVGPPEDLDRWKQEFGLSKLIIAMPSASTKRVREVVSLAQQHGLACVTVPTFDQIASGQVQISHLRPVEIEDLLGREPVALQVEAIRDVFKERTVLVTGAGGSIGSELCRQIACLDVKRLLLVDMSEVHLFQIEQEMLSLGHQQKIVPLAANILDDARMRWIFEKWHPEVVFHAAAYKHVPMMEIQPSEAIKNNALGTARLAELASAYQVERFLMISTDKAVNPTSVMGASKRLAEIHLQAWAAAQTGRTRFMAVRFGNVLGSSGSVVPIFTRQIAAGGPITVTHPEVVRYFMTIPEAVGLVLQSSAQGQGGEIFVLDMGKPVRIVDLARQMIQLSGLRPEVDIEIKYIGLRPGEKLFEELNLGGENYQPTQHPRIMRFVSSPRPLPEIRDSFARIEAGIYQLSAEKLKQCMRELVPEYTPFRQGALNSDSGPKN